MADRAKAAYAAVRNSDRMRSDHIQCNIDSLSYGYFKQWTPHGLILLADCPTSDDHEYITTFPSVRTSSSRRPGLLPILN
eukprot:5290760-Pleurochrysis_carterae.AAC.2